VEITGADIKDAPKAGELAIVEGGYNLPDGTAVKIDKESADESKPTSESDVKRAPVPEKDAGGAP